MTLSTFWFAVIAVLWTGFLVLEGFDFGVGMLHAVVGRDDVGRRVAINTIGPLWDGNEVWFIVAGAGMFAAFPGWYATMFSGFYLALVLLLVALILRGVAFEFRGKSPSPPWRRTWDLALTVGSVLAPLLIGVALADLLYGVPIDARQEYVGGFADLLSGYSVLGGVTIVLVCLVHGATFLTMKTTEDIQARARVVARQVGPVAALAVIGLLLWTHAVAGKGLLPSLVEVTAMLAAIAAAWLIVDGHDGWAFAATTVTMAGVVLSIFADLYPRVMVSSLGAANDLTVATTSSSPYTLRVMTVVTVLLFPVVLAYQAWTYHVFRRRVSRADIRSGH
jgi:cytochrome d ubiquinol oxidase subunit II